jgi:hypothetical protein
VLALAQAAQPAAAASGGATAAAAATPTAAPAKREPERALEANGETRPDLVIPLAHVTALMTVMRLTESYLWPDPFSRTEHFAAHYEEAFTKAPIFDSARGAFEWDGDPWVINTLGHGLFGSELYMRARTCHLPWYGALAFAAASSTVWEYAFEGNGVRPSALDLVYTPLAGAVLGEARYMTWRAARTIRSPALRGTVRALVDPFGETERALGTGC